MKIVVIPRKGPTGLPIQMKPNTRIYDMRRCIVIDINSIEIIDNTKVGKGNVFYK